LSKRREYTMGATVEDMQVGCLWQGDFLLSISLSGHINYLDKAKAGKPWRVIKVWSYVDKTTVVGWITVEIEMCLKLMRITVQAPQIHSICVLYDPSILLLPAHMAPLYNV